MQIGIFYFLNLYRHERKRVAIVTHPNGSDINQAIESTEFLVACMTLEQLQAYVDTIEFTKSITEFFENEIDRSYYKQQTEES